MSNPYRIILADDHTLFRAGLKGLIDKDSGFRVVAEAKDGEEVLEKLTAARCDLVVLDLSMPNLDGMAAIQEIHKKYPKLKILVLTMQKDQEHFKCAMDFGASGYLLKDDAYEQLMLAIKIVLKGKKYISPSLASTMAERFLRTEDEQEDASLKILTVRERQVLKLVARGLSNKNIAAQLKVSIRTVEAHRGNLTNKLGIKTIAGLVKLAISKGLI